MLLRVILAALAVWAGAAPHWAQGRAVGVDLPPESLGFYVIREDRAWGVEASFQWHAGSISQTYQARGSHRATTPDSAGVSGAIVYQRTLRDGPVRPFWFVRPAGIYGWGRHSGYVHTKTTLLELAGGVGVAWSPLDSVALWVRQGVAFGRRIEESTHSYGGPESHRDVTRFRMARPTVRAVYTW